MAASDHHNQQQFGQEHLLQQATKGIIKQNYDLHSGYIKKHNLPTALPDTLYSELPAGQERNDRLRAKIDSTLHSNALATGMMWPSDVYEEP